MSAVKALLRVLLPPRIYFSLQRLRSYLEQRYFKDKLVNVKCGKYSIGAPRNHILVNISSAQPYRDMFVGVSAKFISQKYPNKTIVDIGANIGDTAALMSSYSSNRLILIEASSYYFEILRRNVAKFPNEIVLKKCLISDGKIASGSFHHWKGTASFVETSVGSTQLQTELLSDVASTNVCFVKTDTDGHDFKILLNSLEWLSVTHPAILFENQIRTISEVTQSNELISQLNKIGYRYFIVWDDPGFHILSTTSIEILKDLNNYLFRIWNHPGTAPKNIYNYDVLCLYQEDEDVFKQISDWYKTYETSELKS